MRQAVLRSLALGTYTHLYLYYVCPTQESGPHQDKFVSREVALDTG